MLFTRLFAKFTADKAKKLEFVKKPVFYGKIGAKSAKNHAFMLSKLDSS